MASNMSPNGSGNSNGNDNVFADRLLFAVPKKGRLHGPTMELVHGSDIKYSRPNRLDICLSQNLPLALVFLPASDIPRFVAEGNVDLGITGQDVVAEAEVNVIELLQLGFGSCKVQIQVPKHGDLQSVKDLVGKRIVTSFENMAGKHFDALDAKYLTAEQKQAGVKTQIDYIGGSVEAACALGLADGIVDLVESGETMRAAGLHAIDTLLQSQAVLIQSPHPRHPALVKKITSRLKGVLAASKYVLCNYNCPRAHISEAIKITPGRQAATVSPLDDPDWVAVSSMVLKNEIAEIMDALEAPGVGATDILVMSISNCRV